MKFLTIYFIITWLGICAGRSDVKINRLKNSKSGDFIYNEELYYVKNIVCTMSNCPLPSFCLDNTTCKCGDGLVNFNPNKRKHINHIKDNKAQEEYYCRYSQKSQIIALLLETFISMGVGHFYAGRYTSGVYKLVVSFIPFIISIFLCCYNLVHKETDGEGLKAMGLSLMCMFLCIYGVWQIIDVFNFLMNSYTDGYNIPFYSL